MWPTTDLILSERNLRAPFLFSDFSSADPRKPIAGLEAYMGVGEINIAFPHHGFSIHQFGDAVMMGRKHKIGLSSLIL